MWSIVYIVVLFLFLLFCSVYCVLFLSCFFFQAEDGIRDLVRSRGLGDVYMRQVPVSSQELQAGLKQRFTERDGMIFLPGQAAEYDLSLIHI